MGSQDAPITLSVTISGNSPAPPRRDQLERQAERLRPPRLAPGLLPALGRARQADAAALHPARIEPPVELDRVHHHLRQRDRRAQLADEPGRVEGRAAGELLAVEQDDVLVAQLGEVVGDRRAGDAAADDHAARAIRWLAHRGASSITGAQACRNRHPSASVPSAMQAPSPAVAAVFEPVQTATTLEETVERLGTAIRLGLLGPGDRLPPERELADQFGIARSTLRQALMSLTESGHLVATARPRRRHVRVRRAAAGGEHAASTSAPATGASCSTTGSRSRSAPPCSPPSAPRPDDLAPLRGHVETMRTSSDFSVYRRADVFFHLGVAEAAQSARLRGGDDRGAGQDERADRPHRAPRAGARALERAARGSWCGARAPRRLGAPRSSCAST